MFEAYITNTALYPLMGIEVGTTVHFPTTTQELQAALAKIGIDGKRYSEVFFTSFDSDVLGLYDHLYECENIDELNELGHALLEVRDKGGLETFEAALVLGNHTRSVKDLINLTQNLDLYRFYPDISDDEGLGRLYADELGTIDIPEHIQNYFDYEAYGRDVRINEGGVFAPGGYVSAVPEGFRDGCHSNWGNNCPGAGTATAPGNSRKVITVGASDDRSSPGERRGGYSGSGPTGCCIMKPEILAPGTNIVSLDHHGALYSRKSGTSMATPVVCGALALALQKNPKLRPEELKLKLYESARKETGMSMAWGVLDVDNLLALV